MAQERREFQAEVKELLNLMVHSIYSNTEIFLRELVSNSSDAIDKRKFKALTEESYRSQDDQYFIKLEANSENKTLKIIDNGIGMNHDEVIDHIGTIAKSGTKNFSQMAQDMKENPELIGQFGVGFYSSFMVADKVSLHTRKANESSGWLWESEGDGSFTLQEVAKAEAGTTITLHLKELKDSDTIKKDFTEEWVLRDLVKKYSDFISYPILMDVEREVPELDTEGKPIEGKSKKEIKEETLNSMKALWTKSPSEVKEEEYQEFYKQLTFDWSNPYKYVHYRAEGSMEFSSILYIPSQKPFNFNTVGAKKGLNLYVKKVFIMGDCEELIPDYLRFVKGVVDSSDLSLNISREMLQQDRQMSQIRKAITSKVLNTLKDGIKKDKENYITFWENFGTVLKEGIATDNDNTEKIAETILVKTTKDNEWHSLEDYISRMPEEQKEIYFISGENLDALRNSPHLEALKKKNFEVIIFHDDIDEWVTSKLTEFKTKNLKSITQGNLDIDTEEEKKQKEEEVKKLSEEYKDLISSMKTALSEKVKEVRVSSRLTESPVCLVNDENEMSANMQRIIAQHRGEDVNIPRILEINPTHEVFKKMQAAKEDDKQDWAELFYGQALLTEGSQLPDPVKFSQQINKLLI